VKQILATRIHFSASQCVFRQSKFLQRSAAYHLSTLPALALMFPLTRNYVSRERYHLGHLKHSQCCDDSAQHSKNCLGRCFQSWHGRRRAVRQVPTLSLSHSLNVSCNMLANRVCLYTKTRATMHVRASTHIHMQSGYLIAGSRMPYQDLLHSYSVNGPQQRTMIVTCRKPRHTINCCRIDVQ
jgi:hypothetical protein